MSDQESVLRESDECDGSPPPPLPAAPRPSADIGMSVDVADRPSDDGSSSFEDAEIDIFEVKPITALKMLCSFIEYLVSVTGDVPPMPPVSPPSTPILTRNIPEPDEKTGSTNQTDHDDEAEIKDVPARSKTPIGSPEAHPTEPLHIIGLNAEPLHLQHGAVTRKFYSKKPPPIPLDEYLVRLHRYCPMSTAVYLATALYVHRLAVVERIIHVTARNVHRLLLAGLRVSMKALEDLSYPHQRFAKVGGVSESELGKLEISFCFLTNFEFRVNQEMLHDQAVAMRAAKICRLPTSYHPVLAIRGVTSRRKTPLEYPAEMSASVAG